ncbi:hypothetical protein H2248_007847 [Termitomyces sp. 'cryptogamus']|nr:hypothetical protein H2248_007847 [Termitomyces sp. 'cryptogamus']
MFARENLFINWVTGFLITFSQGNRFGCQQCCSALLHSCSPLRSSILHVACSTFLFLVFVFLFFIIAPPSAPPSSLPCYHLVSSPFGAVSVRCRVVPSAVGVLLGVRRHASSILSLRVIIFYHPLVVFHLVFRFVVPLRACPTPCGVLAL